MSDILKPCPFCGGPAERRKNDFHGDMSMVSCVQCGASAYDRKWQSRSSPADEIERLRALSAPQLHQHGGGVERPIHPPLRQSETDPAWMQVIKLFQRHGAPEPPVRLRDEIVVALDWAWYGQALAQQPLSVDIHGRETNSVDRQKSSDLQDKQPLSVQEGWKLVPVEPTEAMIEAGRIARMNIVGGYDGPSGWEAMLAAAPTVGGMPE